MSHHFDSAAALADGRINPCDLYAFPAAPDTTALVVTVNPDAGRSSPTTFRPDAPYGFVVASNAGTSEDIALRIAFTEPDENGQQQVWVLCADGPAAPHGTAGTALGEGRTGEAFSLRGNGLAWGRLAADSFSGDGVALGKFLQDLTEGRDTPEGFTASPSNLFDQDEISQIMATRPGFARAFIDAIVTDLRDKPQVASSTWMTTITQDLILGFQQSSIEQLALGPARPGCS